MEIAQSHRQPADSKPLLSLIIPLGPGDQIHPNLADWLDLARLSAVRCIVSASEPPSTDNALAADWVQGPAGRGRQMNRGAAMADSQYLWFLHADSVPCASTLASAIAFAKQNQAFLGWFRLAFSSDGPALTALNAMGANLRSRWLGLPYGDQGLIVPSTWFRQLGGYREDLKRGEDLDFVVRAKRAGLALKALDGTIMTSARRYARQGWLATSCQHQWAALKLIQQARRQ